MLKINSDTECPMKKQNAYKVLTLVHNLSSTTKKIISNPERESFSRTSGFCRNGLVEVKLISTKK